MINIFINYILQSSLCLILFMVTYKLLISGLTHFSWMRFYLICSLTLSLVLPLIILPIQWDPKLLLSETFINSVQLPANEPETLVNHTSQMNITHTHLTAQMMALYFILTLYLIGVIFKIYSFSKNLNTVFNFIKKNPKVKETNYWIVNLKSEVPAFSFFNYIFINSNYKDLSPHELQIIKDHEIVHVKQYHTLDLLFVEISGIVFWFNPLMSYLRKSIQEIHEYIVDERIAGQGESKKVYAGLLLNLASDSKVFNLATSFTSRHIERRIYMIAKQRTSKKGKLTFIVLIPLTSFLLLSFSYLGKFESLTFENTQSKSTWAIQLELQKYCGVYLPLKPGPVKIEIQLKNKELVTYLVLVERDKKPVPGIPWTQDPASWTKELEFVSVDKFADSSAYKSSNIVEFILNKENEVTGCFFTQREGLNFVRHEFKKQN